MDIDGAKLHFHKRSTELYYVLDGGGTVSLDGVEHPVSRGSIVCFRILNNVDISRCIVTLLWNITWFCHAFAIVSQ